MLAKITAAAVALAACTGVARAAAPLSPAAPHKVSVELPAGDDVFRGGKEAAAINNNCLACHSAEMVLTQPKLSKPAWSEEVAKMRKVYGAPVADGDVPAIVDYLVKLAPPK